jgi:hypothetical protein
MTTRIPVAPRHATVEFEEPRSEGRRHQTHRPHRVVALAAGGLIALSGAIAACSTPAGSAVPLPSVVIPSGVASAAASLASAASGAAIQALDQVDTSVQSAQSSGTLTSDDAQSLTQLTSAVRTALQSGDTSGAQTALTNLTAKADSLSSKLTGDAGTAVKNAIDALKTAMAGM